MTHIEIILLAFALSIDACIVSFGYGLCINQKKLKYALLLATFTGFFQGLMPITAYYLTGFVKYYIAPYAKWIIFAIFAFLGFKFIKESLSKQKSQPSCIGIFCLFLIGIATSIDAFSAGISLSLYGNHILKPSILILFITFINSLLGFLLGCVLKKFPTKFLEFFAGLILVILSIKALV